MTALRIIEDPGPLHSGKVQPGDMWRDPDGGWAGGESWRVILPNGTCWGTNFTASDGGKWATTGEPPEITVTPSIWDHAGPEWHGWIRGGQFIDA